MHGLVPDLDRNLREGFIVFFFSSVCAISSIGPQSGLFFINTTKIYRVSVSSESVLSERSLLGKAFFEDSESKIVLKRIEALTAKLFSDVPPETVRNSSDDKPRWRRRSSIAVKSSNLVADVIMTNDPFIFVRYIVYS